MKATRVYPIIKSESLGSSSGRSGGWVYEKNMIQRFKQVVYKCDSQKITLRYSMFIVEPRIAVCR